MRVVKLEQALINVLHLSPDDFEMKRYFLFRQAARIIKEIGGINNFHAVEVCEVSDLTFKIPESSLEIHKIIVGNPFRFIVGRKYDFERIRRESDPYVSLRFSEDEVYVSLVHNVSLVTVIYESIMQNDQGDLTVYDIFLPAIENFIVYEQLKKEILQSALKGSQNYYMLRDEVNRYEGLYHRHIIDARSKLRIDEIERKIPPRPSQRYPYAAIYYNGILVNMDDRYPEPYQAWDPTPGSLTWVGSQAEYDSLQSYDGNTYYYITH